jgi:hypothetical protein
VKDGGNGNGVAVVCDRRSPEARQVEEYLRAGGIEGARWFTPRDVDEADEAVREGGTSRIVFTNSGVLLNAVWDEEIDLQSWVAAGACIEFAESRGAVAESTILYVLENWRGWNQRRRYRRAVAGAILSVLVLAAGFLLAALPR